MREWLTITTIANAEDQHMAGNYRNEEERFREQRGMGGRRGFSERDRDEDEMGRDSGRFRGPEYERGWGGRRYESGYDEGWRSEGDRYDTGGYGQRGQAGGRGEAGYRGPSGEREYVGYDEEEGYGAGRSGGLRDRSRQQWAGEGRSRSTEAGMREEPDEMRWGRQQGLYGSTEYGGAMASGMGQSRMQTHVGKGPKGWQRSDERIREDVNEALTRHPGIDASEIEVRVQGGEVTLTGTVTDRQTKRQAEEVVERVFGAKDVQNQIRVKPADTGRQGEREVARTTEREGRFEQQQEQPRRSGQGGSTTSSTTNR